MMRNKRKNIEKLLIIVILGTQSAVYGMFKGCTECCYVAPQTSKERSLLAVRDEFVQVLTFPEQERQLTEKSDSKDLQSQEKKDKKLSKNQEYRILKDPRELLVAGMSPLAKHVYTAWCPEKYDVITSENFRELFLALDRHVLSPGFLCNKNDFRSILQAAYAVEKMNDFIQSDQVLIGVKYCKNMETLTRIIQDLRDKFDGQDTE